MRGDKKFTLTVTPTGAAVTVSGSDELHPYTQDIRAALPASDGSLYLFGVDTYIAIKPSEITVAGIGIGNRSVGLTLRPHLRSLGLDIATCSPGAVR